MTASFDLSENWSNKVLLRFPNLAHNHVQLVWLSVYALLKPGAAMELYYCEGVSVVKST
jgi:hypothetical protein